MTTDWRYDSDRLVSRVVLLSGYTHKWQLEADTNGGGQTRFRVVLDNGESPWYYDPVRAIDDGIVLARKTRGG